MRGDGEVQLVALYFTPAAKIKSNPPNIPMWPSCNNQVNFK